MAIKHKKMSHLTTESKIMEFVQERITGQLKGWIEMLKAGNLHAYEQDLWRCMKGLFNVISEELLVDASQQLVGPLQEHWRSKGGRKIEVRPLVFRIASGKEIEVPSPYVKAIGKEWEGSRHLLSKHWGIMGGASPGLYDKVGYCSAVGPSYNVAHQTLGKFDVTLSKSSVRAINNRLASRCSEAGEENLMLTEDESLKDKRVVISLDGGRTRSRVYNGKINAWGNGKYDTDWIEPKLFVIDVLDDQGQPDRYREPIYGSRFAESDVIKLLERYLRRLEINKAKQIQILADGAPWIWNQIKALLIRLGVQVDRIVETLDYYHASQYVHDLVKEMPKRITESQRKNYLKEFKTWLWEGDSQRIVEKCRELYKRPGQIINRWINYLDKHQDKMQYVEYEKNKLMCGSGIIESGIRRIINLRFKNASTFWQKETVEKLYFLRAAVLSGRWNTLMGNLTKCA